MDNRMRSIVWAAPMMLVAGACAPSGPIVEDRPGNVRESSSTCSGSSEDLYSASFAAILENTEDGRLDKLGNACQIAATFLVGDGEGCSMAQRACDGREDTGIFRVMDPWRPTESVDITCPKFIDLACSPGAEVSALALTCKSALTGDVEEDPLFASPVSAACGVLFGFGGFGATWAVNARFPNVPGSTTALWSLIPTVVGVIGCAMIPF